MNTQHPHSHERGFAALMTSLILSALLTTLVITLSLESFLARKSLSDEEAYRAARYAANSCGVFAIRALSNNPYRFSSGKRIDVTLSEKDTCTIVSAIVFDNIATILVSGHSGPSTVLETITASRTAGTQPFMMTKRIWSTESTK